jgi:hypothetical protein
VDYFEHLQKELGIDISDQIFMKDSSMKPTTLTTDQKAIRQTKIQARPFRISSILHDRSRPSHMHLHRKVLELPPDDGKDERTRRRKLSLTEEDMLEIVERGELPTVSAPLSGDLRKGDQLEQAQRRDGSVPPFPHNAKTERAKDHNRTFITSIGFVEHSPGSKGVREQSLDWLTKHTEIKDFDSPLPASLCESVKALRICLKNPGSLWRVRSFEESTMLEFKLTFKVPPSKVTPELPRDELEEMGDLLKTVSDKLRDMDVRLNEIINK